MELKARKLTANILLAQPPDDFSDITAFIRESVLAEARREDEAFENLIFHGDGSVSWPPPGGPMIGEGI